MATNTQPVRVEPLNPMQPGFTERRYELYRYYREREPVHYAAVPGAIPIWYLFRHDDVAAALKDKRFVLEAHSIDPRLPPTPFPPRFAALNRELGNWILFRDPPYHTRIRALINHAFTTKVVELLKPRIRRLAVEGLNEIGDRDNFDLIGDYARPLPVNVIAELLGVEEAYRARCGQLSILLAGAVGGGLTVPELEEAERACAELQAYFSELLERRAREPGDDLVSAFAARENEEADREERVSMCTLLLFAGHETTVNLIGNGMLALFRQPDQLALLQAEPDRLTGAVEELLRFDAPVSMVHRIAAEDMDAGGRRIRRGERIALVLGSANRDPEQYENPETLDIRRKVTRLLSFGGGIHTCVGNVLARAEAPIALEALFQRFPDLKMGDRPPQRRRSVIFSSLIDFPVRTG